jgi:hypothetical protein
VSFSINTRQYPSYLGYIEKEIVKETDIVLQEAEETCDAPKPKDMISLEVIIKKNLKTSNIFVHLI